MMLQRNMACNIDVSIVQYAFLIVRVDTIQGENKTNCTFVSETK
jgi:hypothetical protein